MRASIHGLASALSLAAFFIFASALPSPAQGPPSSLFTMTVSGGLLAPGGTGTYSLVLDNFGGNIAGWSAEVCHDPSILSLLSVESGATVQTIQYGLPPDFEEIVIWPNGFVQGVIIDIGTSAVLPIGGGYELARATYVTGAFSGAQICVCNSVGSVADTYIVVAPNTSVSPTLGCGDLLPVPPPPPPSAPFVRGDANDDGGMNLADVIWVLDDLFVHGPHTDCEGANDPNSDGNMDIADALFLLARLFGPGPDPAYPYPECGTVPAAWECEEFLNCP